MPLNIRFAPYGREASRTLRDVVAAAQGDDPLAPVTVVVTRNFTGLSLRRLLASGDLGPAPGTARSGLANIRFVTLARLVDEVAGPATDGALPTSAPVVLAVARAVLATVDVGRFASVRGHAGTARSLAAVYRDLRGVSVASRRRLAAGRPGTAEVIGLVGQMEERLGAGWYDEVDRVEAALGVLASGPVGRAPATLPTAVVVHLPTRLSSPDRSFLMALAAVRPVTVVLGTTGDVGADTSARDIAARLTPDPVPGAELAAPTAPTLGDPRPEPVAVAEVPMGTMVIDAPAADAEVRAVVRQLMARFVGGTRLERMAVVHAGTGPYDRLVRETLDAAGIPRNGVDSRTLGSSVAGRMLTGLFDLHERGWHRDEVMAWLAAGPILDEHGSPVPATEWDLLSRRAGIVAGREQWDRRLADFVEDRSAEIADLDGPGSSVQHPTRRPRLVRERRQAVELARFVEELVEAAADAPTTWTAWATWADSVFDRYLGRATTRHRPWPDDEEEALAAIRTSIQGLAVLDRLDVAAHRQQFQQAVAAELDSPAPQTTRFGTGVLVGPVGLLCGLDVDTVFVVGMADGAFPVRRRDDPLIPDEERTAAGADIPLRGARRDDDHRDYLAALAAASYRVLSYARGDQRRGRQQRPARWLLDTVGALEGRHRRLFSRDMESLGPVPGLIVVPSYTEAVRGGGEAYSPNDRDLRSLLRWSDAGGHPADHYLAGVLPRVGLGLEVLGERRSRRFGRFDGKVDLSPEAFPTGLAAMSATSLETYAACPRRYLMKQVLGVEQCDRPEAVLTIDAAERGTLIHTVLERFLAVQMARPRSERIQPSTPWSEADHRRIEDIATTAFAEVEAKGLVGRHVIWEVERTRITRLLHRFLQADDEYRAAGGWVPERVELPFGPGRGAPVVLDLGGDRRVTFRGTIDRVDRRDDGALSVTDYKTGGSDAFGGVRNGDDVVGSGTKLQLPLYGLAVREQAGDRPVMVAYWFVGGRGRIERLGYQLGPQVLEQFGEVLTVLVDGVESGHFPARPGPADEHCKYCEFAAMCPGDRQRSWASVRMAPELASYVDLVEGEDEGGR